jgi:hypothetical protein
MIEGGEPARGPRWRIDGFTPEKRRVFLAALGRFGCITDAARVAGVSTQTVGRHRKKWADFARACETARLQAAGPLEALAWERAVVGAETIVVRNGEVVEVRKKPSDAMLRLILQASDPEKFGSPNRGGGETARQMEKRLRRQIEKEIREQIAASRPTIEQVTQKIIRKVEAIKRHKARYGSMDGWEQTELSIQEQEEEARRLAEEEDGGGA